MFGPPPVLSSEDSKAYYAMWARILESIKASDFIEQMLAKDLADATWEMKRYSRHKALVIERKYLEQQELYEDEEAEERKSDAKRPQKKASKADGQSRAGRARSSKASRSNKASKPSRASKASKWITPAHRPPSTNGPLSCRK